VSLVLHRRSSDLRCHYCGLRQRLPGACPACGGDLMDPIGAGTEKVAERFAELYPDVPAAILDRDTVRRRGGLEATLGAFDSGATRVLIGTQMVAKGHHFPNVTLTGVISADALLSLPDFRAGERTFQLLTQVAGRAGRGTRPGRVVIQTYHPDHPAVRSATRHDSAAYVEQELTFRQAFFYPPAVRMALIRFEGAAAEKVRQAAEAAGRAALPALDRTWVRGPAPAPIERLRGHWRWQLLLSAASRDLLRELLARVEAAEVPSSVRRIVDVDPLSTL
jgi:primosomal protein N' (replication factor Y)